MENEGCNGFRFCDSDEFDVVIGNDASVVVDDDADEDINVRPDIEWFDGVWGG